MRALAYGIALALQERPQRVFRAHVETATRSDAARPLEAYVQRDKLLRAEVHKLCGVLQSLSESSFYRLILPHPGNVVTWSDCFPGLADGCLADERAIGRDVCVPVLTVFTSFQRDDHPCAWIIQDHQFAPSHCIVHDAPCGIRGSFTKFQVSSEHYAFNAPPTLTVLEQVLNDGAVSVTDGVGDALCTLGTDPQHATRRVIQGVKIGAALFA